MGGLGNSTSKDSIVANAAASASTAVQTTPLAGPASCSAIVYSMCVYCCCQSVLVQKRSLCVVAIELRPCLEAAQGLCLSRYDHVVAMVTLAHLLEKGFASSPCKTRNIDAVRWWHKRFCIPNCR
ncbi:uncharacterized protein TrAtP1_006445 [Trichoderma atroviride]|uniref:uncharacterized protein n=1 Tax=Hypocrea atroviridis TaxID=63577 RepID=UPI00332C60C8|nr:hypothetical protein TrAtP1_006445 [Trichoderma atroviride]